MLWPLVAMLLSAAPLDGGAPDALARAFVANLTSGNFQAASARLSPELARTLDASKLAVLWGDPTRFWGAFQEVKEVRAEGDSIVVTCLYEHATQKAKVTLDAQGRVTSLWITQGTPAEDFDLAGRAVVEELTSAALPKVLARFAPEAKKTSTADLGKAWRDATMNAGAFQRVSAVKNDRSAARITTVDVTCEFARARVVVRLSFDDALRLHGLLFLPH